MANTNFLDTQDKKNLKILKVHQEIPYRAKTRAWLL